MDEDWVSFQGQQYSFAADLSKGRDEAEKLCASNNSYLADITSKEIEEFIDSTIDKNGLTLKINCIWIGLKNKAGTWTWPSGKTLGYQNWEPGEPNLIETQECVNKHISGPYEKTKRWFNEYCDSGGQHCGRICQKIEDITTTSLQLPVTSGGASFTSSITIETTPASEANATSSPTVAIVVPVVLIILAALAAVIYLLYRRNRLSSAAKEPKGKKSKKSDRRARIFKKRKRESHWHDLGEVEGVESRARNVRDSFISDNSFNSGAESENGVEANAETHEGDNPDPADVV